LIYCLVRGDDIKRVSTDLLVAAVEELNELFQFREHLDDGETVSAAEWGKRGRMIHRVAVQLGRVDTDGSTEAQQAARELLGLALATTDEALAYGLLNIRETFTPAQRDLLSQMGRTR